MHWSVGCLHSDVQSLSLKVRFCWGYVLCDRTRVQYVARSAHVGTFLASTSGVNCVIELTDRICLQCTLHTYLYLLH